MCAQRARELVYVLHFFPRQRHFFGHVDARPVSKEVGHGSREKNQTQKPQLLSLVLYVVNDFHFCISLTERCVANCRFTEISPVDRPFWGSLGPDPAARRHVPAVKVSVPGPVRV